MAGRKKENTPGAVAYAVIGLVTRAKDELSLLYEELEERGRLRSGDSEQYLRKVLERIRGEREDFKGVVREIIRDAADSAGLATAGDVDNIKVKLEKLYEQLKDASGTVRNREKNNIE